MSKKKFESKTGSRQETLSEKRAAAGRRRQELHPRPATKQIRVEEAAVEAMRKHKIKDRPRFVSQAILRHLDHNFPPGP